MNQLTRRFRYKGMGCTLITQRPAELHKSVLGQIDLLIALRVISPQDVKALDEWVKRNASEAERAQFLSTLSGLSTGTAWVWSPQWLRVFEQVTIRTRRTYDSSATPKVGMKRSAPRQLAEIHLTHLSEQLAGLMEKTRRHHAAVAPVRLREHEKSSPVPTVKKAEGSGGESEREHSLVRQIATLQEERAHQEEVIKGLRKALAAQEAQLDGLSRQVERLRKITVTLDGAHIPALELPGVLQLDRMQTHVAQATIEVSRVGALPALVSNEAAAPVSRPVESMCPEESGEVSAPALLFSEQKLLKRLLAQVQALSTSEKALLTWLLEHDGVEISSQALADAVSMCG